jgi:hypothetical protein
MNVACLSHRSERPLIIAVHYQYAPRAFGRSQEHRARVFVEQIGAAHVATQRVD